MQMIYNQGYLQTKTPDKNLLSQRGISYLFAAVMGRMSLYI